MSKEKYKKYVVLVEDVDPEWEVEQLQIVFSTNSYDAAKKRALSLADNDSYRDIRVCEIKARVESVVTKSIDTKFVEY